MRREQIMELSLSKHTQLVRALIEQNHERNHVRTPPFLLLYQVFYWYV